MSYLRLLGKDGEEKRIAVPVGQPFTIGRGNSSSFQIRDLKMSRVHCELTVSGGVAILTDLGSMNGTHVNGKRITSTALKNGDVVQAGYTQLQYVEDDVGGPAEPPPPGPAAPAAAAEPAAAAPPAAPEEPPEPIDEAAEAADDLELAIDETPQVLPLADQPLAAAEPPPPAAEPVAEPPEPAVLLEPDAAPAAPAAVPLGPDPSLPVALPADADVVPLEAVPLELDRPVAAAPADGGVVLLEPNGAAPAAPANGGVVLLDDAAPVPTAADAGVVLLDDAAPAPAAAAAQPLPGADDRAIAATLNLTAQAAPPRLRKGEKACSSCRQPVTAKEVKSGAATVVHGQVCCPRCVGEDPLLGKTIAGYRFDAKLGSGAWSVTYKAQQLSMARAVVLRVLRREVAADSELITQFLATVKQGGQISHPNLARIYDIGRAEGLCYVCVEYVDGENLGHLSPSKGGFPVEDAADIILQAAGAVDVAHRKEVFHCDIRPSNIILNDERVPKLIGLGFAKSIVDAAAAGAITVQYSPDLLLYWAPECVVDPARASREADVYSLGAVLYATIAGRPPFDAADPLRLIGAIRRLRPTPLDALRNDVPHRLSAVAAKAMAKSPADRYPDCQHFVRDLRSALQ